MLCLDADRRCPLDEQARRERIQARRRSDIALEISNQLSPLSIRRSAKLYEEIELTVDACAAADGAHGVRIDCGRAAAPLGLMETEIAR